MRRILVDTDPGIDDCAALLFAIGSRAFEIEALTTVFGNSDVEHCSRNALTILEAAGVDGVAVYQGAGKPLLREYTGSGKLVHGENGLGDVPLEPPRGALTPGHGAVQIVERIMAAPGEIDLVALGPLTNVALALTLEPALAQAVRSLIVMGGTVAVRGNVTPVATANFWNDPEAAAIVYRSGAPIVQSSLDVARAVYTPHDRLQRVWLTDTRAARLLRDVTPFHENAYRAMGVPAAVEGLGVHYNDVPSIAYLLEPELFDTVHTYVEIETHGEHTAGETVVDLNNVKRQPPNATVCRGVDRDGVVELFTNALMSDVFSR